MAKMKNIGSPAAHMADKKHVSGVSDPKSDVMKMANEARSKANSMSDEKREESFNHGMRLIYGCPTHPAAKVSRP